jgi:TatA/E family protein of Tat protein translocase
MFGIGGTELAIILIFGFLIFGPDKLPAIAKTIGQAIAKFRDVQGEMNRVVKEEIYDPEKDKDNPFQRPLDKMAQMDQRQVKTETFAERKARHDRERAERQAAMDKAAGNQAPEAASAGAASAKPAAASNTDAATVATAAVATAAKPSTEPVAAKPTPKPRPKVSAAELYGIPATHKPAPKSSNDSQPEGSE